MGYVTSTPNSKPTAIMGIIENPIIKQKIAVIQVSPVIKLKETATVLRVESIVMTVTESL